MIKSTLKGFLLLLTRRDAILVATVTFFIFLFLIFLTEKWSGILNFYSFENFSFTEKTSLSLTYFFDWKSSFLPASLALAVVGSLFGAINITLSYLYFKTRGASIIKNGLSSGTGLVFAFLGIGCAACGTALLSTLLGLLGLSSVLGFLPYDGLEIGFIGLAILIVATLVLARKLGSPAVC
jgi:heme/copper-type cytochrome/quinol oxidase subunit 1